MIALGLMLSFSLATLANAVRLTVRFRPRGRFKFAVYALSLLGLVALALSGAATIQLLGLPAESRSAVLSNLDAHGTLVSVIQLILLIVFGNAVLSWRLTRLPRTER